MMTRLINSVCKELKKVRQDTYALAVCPAFFVFFGFYVFSWFAVNGNGANLFFAFAIALVSSFCLIVFTSRVHYKNEFCLSTFILLVLFLGITCELCFIKNKFDGKNKVYVLRDEYATVKSVRKWGKGQAIVFERHNEKQKFVLYHWGDFSDVDKLYPIGATYSVSGLCHPFTEKTRKKKNVKSFDQWKFWQGHGVSSCLTPSRESKMLAPPTGLFAIRQILKEEINISLPSRSKGYMEIFMLGERGKTLENLYKQSGVLHLMAISGLHIGLFLALLCFLFKNKFLRFFGGTFLLWSYVILAGCPVSAIRSAIMAQVLLFSLLFDLPRNSLNSVCVAGCLILLNNPFCVVDVGFTLSFICVLFLSVLLGDIVSIGSEIFPNGSFWHSAFSLCITSALIWVITAPILAYYFGNVSLTGILSNIFILPVFSVVFPLAVILCLVSLLFPFLPFISSLLEAMLTSFEEYVSVFAKVPAINICQTNFLIMSASFIFFVALFFKLTSNKAKSCLLAIIFSSVVIILTG